MKLKKMNKKGFAWALLWAIPTALAALVWGVNELSTPKPAAGSFESIISSIPIWGWVIVGLMFLVLLTRR